MTTCFQPEVAPELRVVIPFPNEEQANIAYNSLRVDREPKRSQVHKTLLVEKHCLVLTLVGPDARSLRLSSNSFFDHLTLVQKTIDTFSLDKYLKKSCKEGEDTEDLEGIQTKKICLINNA